ncbi:MAG: leucine-rich repeat domain-containing protein [Clostridiales bacterium]|nr:leucine-rich repeat domain-containing protein [Clostridiales bacterium]
MKKKFLHTILSLVCVLACAFGLVACGGNKPHAHEWAQSWEEDDTHHWHNCAASDCDITDNSQKEGYAEHDFSNGDCVCGRKPNYTVGLQYGLSYEFDVYTVEGIGTATDNDIVIPSEYKGKPVTKIKERAFENNTNITSIKIPDSITVIERETFKNCSNASSIELPAGITSIGESAFEGCSSLTSITIPNGVTKIERSAFKGCGKISSIVLPNSLTSIKESAFEGCGKIPNITIPNGVTDIRVRAFADCIGLESVSFLNNDKIQYLSDSMFRGCSNLSNITLPDGMTRIGNGVFLGCSKLASITIPDSVTSLGNSVFEGCSSLTSITIPSGVKILYFYAFSGCTSLTSLIIHSDNDDFLIHDETVFEGCPIETATIPSRVCKFVNTSALKTVVITNGERIYYQALKDCRSLTSLTIPASVQYIDEEALFNCTNLRNVFFKGTQEQWNFIQVGSNWNYGAHFIVHCTDGDIDYN